MRKLAILNTLFLSVLLLTSCGKTKVAELESELSTRNKQIEQLEKQVDHLQETNGSLLDRMEDISLVSKEGATSIRKSLENITQQYDFIEDLTTKIQAKDSINLALVMNIKRSLDNVNDEDVQVEVKGGVVYVSLSDKLLFSSGSSKVTSQANDVLGKLAGIMNDHRDLNILVEGHTDDVPINNSCTKDNWDLSVKRATSIVRVLTEDHYVDPARLTASGRGQYIPKTENDSAEGRSLNRRTEIIIMPKLDQFFELMEPAVVKG
ncbi:MAG: OmpA family protein [Bacteroidota bacterium]